MMADEELDRRLSAVLSRELEEFQALESVQQLTAGASQETYCVSTVCSTGSKRLALRRMPASVDTGAAVGGITPDIEAHLFRLALAAGIPGPEVLYLLQAEDGLGAGFLMQWLEGETLGQRINRSDEFRQLRPALARECGQILGRIHSIDWRAAALEAVLPVVDPGTLVDETWNRYRLLDVPAPMIDFTWRWLKDNLPRNSRKSLVHGDFRNGNLMIRPEGIVAVLDWELAQIGDPLRDLGWLCVNSWRFGSRELPVGGFGEIDDLLAGYNDTSGLEVSREQLKFWQVFGSFWWAVTTLHMASTWRTGETPSLERPVIGRRSSEAQMDCVNLLIPGEFSLPDTSAALSEGTQLPMPAELLEGVVLFLREEVAKKLQTRDRFLAKVAANSLQIAQREMQYGNDPGGVERSRLEHILGRGDDLDTLRRSLVERLRGTFALDTPGLAEHLRQTVASQLSIDQPGYSALRLPGSP